MSLNLRIIFFIVFLFLIKNTFAQESMMESVSYPFLEKLIAAAKANYPKYKVYDKRIDIAQANVQKAKLDWFNFFSFSYVPPVTTAAALSNSNSTSNYNYGFTVNVGGLLQKPAAVRVAKRELDISRLDQDEYNLNIEAVVKQRYFAYVAQLTVLNWKIKSLASAERASKDIQYKFEKGEVTFEVYNRSETFYTGVVQDKIKSEAEFLITKSMLEEIIGAKLETIQ